MDKIIHNPDQGKFLIEKPEGSASLSYSLRKEGVIECYEVYVDHALRGQGLAGKITLHALEYARKNGLRVNPLCPYVDAYMRKNSGKYGDLRI